MSKKASQFAADLIAEIDGDEPPAVPQRASEFVAQFNAEAANAKPFVGPIEQAPFSGPREEDALPWWKQGFDTPPNAALTSGKDIVRAGVGVADLVASGASAASNQLAGTLAGVIGAIDPNDTYEAARARERGLPYREQGANLKTGGGRELGAAAGEVIQATGIPQVAGPVLEAAQEHFPVISDLAASALTLAPTTRLVRGAPDTPVRTIYGESGEVLGREAIRPDAPIQLGASGGGAAARSVDLNQIRSPELRAELRAKAAAGTLKPEVAEAHIAADQLDLPPLTRGQATGNPADISREQNLRGTDDRLRARFTAQNEAMVEKLDDIRRETTPNVVGSDVIQNGQTLVDSYKAYDTDVRADISAKYSALREAMKETGSTIDHQAFGVMAENALRESGKTHWLPAEVRSLMNDAKEGMTFRDFETMRTVLASAARTAERQGNGNAAGAISAVRSALEELPLAGPAAETLKPLADAARTAAKSRFRSIELDPAYRAAVDDDVPLGEASALADKFVDQYVIRGRAANIARMRQTLADDPMAGETITAGTLNYLKQRAVPSTGNFAAARYNETLRELDPRMRELLPAETAEQLQALGSYARATTAQPRGSFVNTSNTATALLAEGAQGAMESAVMAKTGIPIPMIRNYVERRRTTKYVDEALKPGAGLDAQRLNQLLRPSRETQ